MSTGPTHASAVYLLFLYRSRLGLKLGLITSSLSGARSILPPCSVGSHLLLFSARLNTASSINASSRAADIESHSVRHGYSAWDKFPPLLKIYDQ